MRIEWIKVHVAIQNIKKKPCVGINPKHRNEERLAKETGRDEKNEKKSARARILTSSSATLRSYRERACCKTIFFIPFRLFYLPTLSVFGIDGTEGYILYIYIYGICIWLLLQQHVVYAWCEHQWSREYNARVITLHIYIGIFVSVPFMYILAKIHTHITAVQHTAQRSMGSIDRNGKARPNVLHNYLLCFMLPLRIVSPCPMPLLSFLQWLGRNVCGAHIRIYVCNASVYIYGSLEKK